MRRLNKWISIAMLLLLLIHGIAGGFQMMGVIPGGSKIIETLTYLMLILTGLHIVIGIYLTFDTMRTSKKAGASYFKQNKLFWTRRISGFLMIIFIVFHVIQFSNSSAGGFRLKSFGETALIASVLLVVSLLIHLISNIRPLFIAIGASKLRKIMVDVMFILAIVLVFCAIAFFVYYFRWNINWQ